LTAHVPLAAAGHVSLVSTERHRVVRALVERESADLLSYFLRRTASPDDAADLLGDTLLVIWRRESSIPSDQTEARMWMFGIARRVLSGERRSRSRRNSLSEQLGARLATVVRSSADEDPSGVRAAIATLPETDREIVRLVYWDGFTLAEAAQIMAMRPATVRSRVARARAKLRQHLDGH
jgi:RNA polymerase sigma-70 factor (ECF subfamily)